MVGALEVDQVTDDDSDGEHKGFGLKLPELTDLSGDFEKDDEVVAKAKETTKSYKTEMKAKGLDVEPFYDIKNSKKEKASLLDANISMQRDEWTTRLMGMVEDVNETVKDSKNKQYLR